LASNRYIESRDRVKEGPLACNLIPDDPAQLLEQVVVAREMIARGFGKPHDKPHHDFT
jgi:hypothetical protein